MPAVIQLAGRAVDLSTRVFESHAVVGSPALAAETIVAQLTVTEDLAVGKGVFMEGLVSFTVGTSGTASTVRIRQTNVAGTILANTGALTTAAASLVSPGIQGIDPTPVLPGQIYVLTLQITAGAAVSTVSAVSLFATVV